MVLTADDKSNAVAMETKTFDKHLKAAKMERLLARGGKDIGAGRTRPIRSFLKAFKHARKVSRYNHARGGKIV